MDKLDFSSQHNISDSELNSFILAVKTRFGLDFMAYEKKSLKRGLARMMTRNNFNSLLDFWSKVLRDRALVTEYVDELLVNLTEFFRNYELWQKIKEDVLQKLAFQKKLNIWHAGCSTGEEVYTMGIVLKERFMLHKTNLLATDLSTKALTQAQEGKYNKYVLKKCKNSYELYNPNGKVERYFKEVDNYFFITKQFKKNVTFQLHNLVQDSMNDKFDVIFCRNVMIYFDDQLKMKVLKMFYTKLVDNGFLVIGYYDMLPEEAKTFFKLYCPSTRIYMKNV